MTPLQHTEEVIKDLRARTDEVILFYSAGKDSITCLHLLRKYKFKRIVCVYMAFIKGLTHNRHLLDWVTTENELLEVTHWGTATYVAQNFMRIANKVKAKPVKWIDIENYVKSKTGIQWMVTGMKQGDSLNRRLMLRRFHMEAIDLKMKRAHILSHWKNTEVRSYLTMARLPQPVKYDFGKSSQGIDLNPPCMKWFKKNHPADYQKILQVFPLADAMTLENEPIKVPKVRAGNAKPRRNKKSSIQPKNDLG
jgi:3'-phosphoadenosine 5'-phosphosulfate sulfotransferase (PAPS reductase)/FAD synthetase